MLKVLSTTIAAVTVSVVGFAAPAAADEQFSIVGTDIGIYPRTSTSMGSERVGSALPDGTPITGVCELEGDIVDNGYAPSNIWMRLNDGTYLPNAFILTGYDGWTPTLPNCNDNSGASSSAPDEQPNTYDGITIVNDRVSTQLINHYYDGTGTTAVIDWSFFEQSDQFMNWLRSQPTDSIGRQYASNPAHDGDIYAAVGSFSAARISENCFAVRDWYDFNPDKVTNWPYLFNWLDTTFGGAAEFEVRSSGCTF